MAHPRQRKKIKNPNSKVTRRVANKHAKKLPRFADSSIKKAWNTNLSLKQNFLQLGLSADVNSDFHKFKQAFSGEAIIQETPEGLVYFEERLHKPAETTVSNNILKELEDRATTTAPCKKQQRHLSRNEMKLKEVLGKLYGEDFEKMARDRKLNPYQFTANQLRRLWEK